MTTIDQFPDFIREGVEIEIPLPGVRGWMIQGEHQQAVFIEFEQTIDVPEHTHSDQWEFALAGKVELHRLGGTEVYTPTSHFFIPAGQPHSATVHAGYKAMILFNEPDRYKAKA